MRITRTGGMMPVMIAFVALALTSSSVPAQRKAAASDPGSEVVATVNGEKITKGQIIDNLLADQAMKLNVSDPMFADRQRAMAGVVGALVIKKMAASNYKPYTITKADIIKWAFEDGQEVVTRSVENVIQIIAVRQEGVKAGIKLSDVAIAEQVHKSLMAARTNFRKTEPDDNKMLKMMGFRPSYLRPFVETQLYLEGLIKKEIQAKVGHPITPNDYLSASHILVKVDTTSGQPTPDGKPAPPKDPEKLWQDAKKKIDEIAADIKAGKLTFEQSATRFSDDGSKFNEGKLGPFIRGQMVPEFEKVAFELKKGVVSEPVKTQFGYHLIKIDALGSELTAPQREQALDGELKKRMTPKVQEIRTKANIVNKAPVKAPTFAQPAGR